MTRGDLVIVDFRPTNPAAGVRPALVVQNDRDNVRMRKTIVVQVTTNLSRVTEPTQLLINPTHPDWKRSGLKHPSAVACSNIYTIKQIDGAVGQFERILIFDRKDPRFLRPHSPSRNAMRYDAGQEYAAHVRT